METVITLSVVGILLVGCWHVGNVFQRHLKQLEIERKWDWAIWGPFLIAIVVIAWVEPILIGCVVAAYLFYWSVDWIWFRYVDWNIARANREDRERRTDDQADQPRRGRAGGALPGQRR